MKLLIDENLPKRLKIESQKHEVFTVGDIGWKFAYSIEYSFTQNQVLV